MEKRTPPPPLPACPRESARTPHSCCRHRHHGTADAAGPAPVLPRSADAGSGIEERGCRFHCIRWSCRAETVLPDASAGLLPVSPQAYPSPAPSPPAGASVPTADAAYHHAIAEQVQANTEYRHQPQGDPDIDVRYPQNSEAEGVDHMQDRVDQ